MDKAQVLAFAQAIGTKVEKVSPQGWANCRCPLAPWTHDSGKDSTPSFAIRVVPGGLSYFQCYTCQKGDLYHLIRLLKGFGAEAPRYRLKDALALLAVEEETDTVVQIKEFEAEGLAPDDDGNNTAIFPENWLHTFKKAHTVPAALAYLRGRGLADETIVELDVRYDTQRNAVCFPIRDALGHLCGLRGRYIEPDPDGPPYHIYKNPQKHYNRMVWYGEHWVDFDRLVILVESVFDLAAVFPIYPNVLAPLTVGMSKAKVQRIGAAFDVVTLFDVGEGGDKARDLIDHYLTDTVKVHLLPEGPHRCNPGHPAKDPGDMQPSALAELLAPFLPQKPP